MGLLNLAVPSHVARHLREPLHRLRGGRDRAQGRRVRQEGRRPRPSLSTVSRRDADPPQVSDDGPSRDVEKKTTETATISGPVGALALAAFIVAGLALVVATAGYCKAAAAAAGPEPAKSYDLATTQDKV